MKIKFIKIDKYAKSPSYAKDGDAGMDLTAVSQKWDNNLRVWSYGTGIAVEIPTGYVGLLFPRSSIFKSSLSQCNSVGVIDSGYRGEIIFKHYVIDNVGMNNSAKPFEIGDRIGQIIILPYPEIEFEEVDILEESERGIGGFGSTGRNNEIK